MGYDSRFVHDPCLVSDCGATGAGGSATATVGATLAEPVAVRGMIAAMPAQRDPLSKRYDRATGALVGEALAKRGRWVYRAVPRPSTRGAASRAWLAERGIELDAVDSGGLTAYQRSYQRSLYHSAGALGISAPDGNYSLQREWGPLTRHGRLIGVRVSTKQAARRAVRRKPAADRYTENMALRSGAVNTGQNRF